jgi:hypothetical protein
MPEANEHSEVNEDAQRAATQPDVNSPVQDAADKLHAAMRVLHGVQTFRYDHTNPVLREAMRQTALAALDSALTDLHEVRQMQR